MKNIDSLLRQASDDVSPSRGFVRQVLHRISAMQERRQFASFLLLSASLAAMILVVSFCASLLVAEVTAGVSGDLLASIVEDPFLLLSAEAWMAVHEGPLPLYTLMFLLSGSLSLLILRKFFRAFHLYAPPSYAFR